MCHCSLIKCFLKQYQSLVLVLSYLCDRVYTCRFQIWLICAFVESYFLQNNLQYTTTLHSMTLKLTLDNAKKNDDMNISIKWISLKIISSLRSSHQEVFLGKGVKGVLRKIWSKLTGEYPCQSAISIKCDCKEPLLKLNIGIGVLL